MLVPLGAVMSVEFVIMWPLPVTDEERLPLSEGRDIFIPDGWPSCLDE